MSKISELNGFRAVAALTKAAQDPRVAEIEGNGMDEGRVMIILYRSCMFAHLTGRPWVEVLRTRDWAAVDALSAELHAKGFATCTAEG